MIRLYLSEFLCAVAIFAVPIMGASFLELIK